MLTDNVEKKHHKQEQLCTTRPHYRQGRNLTAVKIYTISSESQHLFIYGVPKIKLRTELKTLCTKYGQILNIHVVTDHDTEQFTECYHVHYQRIQSARIAKRLLDSKSFYGGLLHVCYAPEYESVEETRMKLLQRDKDVISRLGKKNINYPVEEKNPIVIRGKKRKRDNSKDDWLTDLDPATAWDIHPEETSENECNQPDLFQEVIKSVQCTSEPPAISTRSISTCLIPSVVIKTRKKEIVKKCF